MQWIPKETQLILPKQNKRPKGCKATFSRKHLRSFHVSKPRVITVDKNPAYPIAIQQLKKEKKMPEGIQIRQVKYLNNIVEQDHRFIKKRVRYYVRIKILSIQFNSLFLE